MAIKIRRGLEADRTSVIFEEGEVLYTTDTKSFFIGDGVTAGGNQIGGTTAASLLKTTVHNATGATLTAGQVVYLSGNTGNKPNAVLAKADSEATSSKTIGLIITNISNNANGDIATDGLIGDLNTSAFAAGDLLWLSDSVAGGVTTIVPDTPNHAVFIGYVVAAHPTQGEILIHIQNGYELNELHDVKITSVANGDGLIYDSTLGYWKNSAEFTTQGNTFNAANKLVKLDGTAKLPAVDGSQLTNLPTPSTPTLAQVTSAGNTTTNAITVGGLTVATNLIYTDTVNGRVGIGTVSPSVKFNVVGEGLFTSSSAVPFAVTSSSTVSLIRFTNSSGHVDFGRDGTGASIQVAGIPRFYIANSGNIGVGTYTDAGYKLDVNGTVRIVASVGNSGALNIVNNFSGIGPNGVTILFPNQTISSVQSAGFYVGKALSTNNGWGINYIHNSNGSTSNRGTIAFYGVDNIINWFASGNVSINTTTDAGYKLDVNGTVRVSGQATFANTLNVNYINMQNTGAYNAEYFAIAGTGGRFNNQGLVLGTSGLSANAILQCDSTTKGVLFPRMTTTQKNAIATPAAGLVVYDTTLNKLCVYTSVWETITSI